MLVAQCTCKAIENFARAPRDEKRFSSRGLASLRRPSDDIKSKQTKKALQSLPLRVSRDTRDTGHVYHVTASKYNAAQSRDVHVA